MSEPRDHDERSLQAVALGYQRGRDTAPRILAGGRAEIARRILERADEYGIPIERDPDLLECLAPLTIGSEIPPEAYAAVASILAFLYRLNGDGLESSPRD